VVSEFVDGCGGTFRGGFTSVCGEGWKEGRKEGRKEEMKRKIRAVWRLVDGWMDWLGRFFLSSLLFFPFIVESSVMPILRRWMGEIFDLRGNL